MVSRERLGPPIIVALAAFALARTTLLGGVGFWDTAELQAVAPLMGTAHPTGIPTYVLLGWLASVVLQPFGDPALRMNLLAALSVAVAAGVTVDLVRALTRSTWLAMAAGLGFALTPIVWKLASHAEAHALHLALLAIVMRLLLAWQQRGTGDVRGRADPWLVATGVALGLSAGNHSLTLLLVVPVGLFIVAVQPDLVRRPRLVGAFLAALLATTALVYLELPLRAGPFPAPLVYGRPDTWDGFWYIVLAEQFQGSIDDPFGNLGPKLADLGTRLVAQFGPLAFLVPVAFLATARRHPRFALLTGSTVAITVFFALSYLNADIGRYYAGPILLVWTWLGALGAEVARLVGTLADRRPAGSMAAGSMTAGILAIVLVAPTLLAIPGRQAALDESRNDTGARWLDAALAAFQPGAIVVSWWSYSTPLWYAQRVEGRRPDITIVDDRTRLDDQLGGFIDVIEANLGRRPVYVMRSDEAELALLDERYVIEVIETPVPEPLIRVIAHRAAGR